MNRTAMTPTPEWMGRAYDGQNFVPLFNAACLSSRERCNDGAFYTVYRHTAVDAAGNVWRWSDSSIPRWSRVEGGAK